MANNSNGGGFFAGNVPSPVFTVSSSNNKLGIGHTAPSQVLSVNGGLNVNGTGVYGVGSGSGAGVVAQGNPSLMTVSQNGTPKCVIDTDNIICIFC